MKIIILAWAMLTISLFAYAQVDPIRAEQNHIFQNINKMLIPTGYLNEYGPEVIV